MTIKVEEILVDQNLVVVPTLESWSYLKDHVIYDHMPVFLTSTKRIVFNLIDFVSAHSASFRLGIYRGKNIRKSWLVVPLFKNGNEWQRVQIEYPVCLSCESRLVIANPTEPSLYFGLENEQELISKALKLPQVKCPECDTKIARFAIWVEKDLEVDCELS